MQTPNHGEHTQGTIQVRSLPEQAIISAGIISPTAHHGFKTRKWVEKKGDAELIKRDVKTSQGHATKSEKKIPKRSENLECQRPKW